MLLLANRRWAEIARAVSSARVLTTLTVTTLLISSNWLIYIWSVVTDRVTQASLGYYINPLVTVLLGMLFLGERLNRKQWLSVVLAGAGVGLMIGVQGAVPWIAFGLAGTFAFYSLLRKRVRALPITGLAVETGLLSPFALFFLVHQQQAGSAAFATIGFGTDLLLALSGLVTALPLVLFTYGARRLRLSTIGLLQYSAPTLQFLLAVVVFREPFSRLHLLSFAFIWVALLVFSHDLWERRSE